MSLERKPFFEMNNSIQGTTDDVRDERKLNFAYNHQNTVG